MQKKAGFSLVELMIVLAIIAILSAIITPNIINWLRGQGLKTAISELQGNLQLAKLGAIRQNQSCAVTFNTGSGSYSIPCANKRVLLSSYSGGVVFGMPPSFAGTMAGTITFSSDGTSSLSSVFLTDNTRSAYYRIQTFLSGGIVTSKWDGSSWK
ncbi:MAG: GspH/FimT family pseudopilin [Pseudomonadota bacterium]